MFAPISSDIHVLESYSGIRNRTGCPYPVNTRGEVLKNYPVKLVVRNTGDLIDRQQRTTLP